MQHPPTRTQAQEDARREVERTMGHPWYPETHERYSAFVAALPPLQPNATAVERELRSLQEQARREWAASAALRDEFVTEDAYLAFKAAEAKGRFKALNAQPGVYRGRA